jgi:hypothetical protein
MKSLESYKKIDFSNMGAWVIIRFFSGLIGNGQNVLHFGPFVLPVLSRHRCENGLPADLSITTRSNPVHIGIETNIRRSHVA